MIGLKSKWGNDLSLKFSLSPFSYKWQTYELLLIFFFFFQRKTSAGARAGFSVRMLSDVPRSDGESNFQAPSASPSESIS